LPYTIKSQQRSERPLPRGRPVPEIDFRLAKDIAAVLGVNKNTVLRALQILRDEGLLEFRRGRGVTVVGGPAHGLVVSRAREFVDFARRYGYRRDDVLKLIEDLP
jgi:GntR family transcriptional regulator